MLKYQLVIFSFILINSVQNAKILGLFPFPSRSHQILGSALLKELAARGHEVTMVSPFPLKEPVKNYKDIFLSDVVRVKTEKIDRYMHPNISTFERVTHMPIHVQWIVEAIMEDKNFGEFLNSGEKYDIVLQMWAVNEMLLGVGHKLNATTIAFGPTGDSPFINYINGAPNPTSYVPQMMSSLTDNMTFLQRVFNTLITTTFNLAYQTIGMRMQAHYLKKYFPNSPPLEELIENVDLAIICSHITTETARPYMPNTIQIGGFHLQDREELPNDLTKYLNESKNGVILFSFGTNVISSSIPSKILKIILKSLGKIKYDVLWKFETDIEDKPKNVKIIKWLPQISVLEHRNVKGFITHGGLGSIVEAVYHGIPVLCIPFFGDQMKNSADSVAKGYGKLLNINDITEEKMTEAILEIVENPIYKRNIMMGSDILKNQEMNPMDKAVFWVEHVIKHKGAKHLKSMATKLPFYQYYLLDVFAFIFAFVFVVVFVLWFVMKKLIGLICRKKCTKKIKKN